MPKPYASLRREDDMSSTERRVVLKAAGASAIALSLGDRLLTANQSRAQGAPIRAWPNRRLLDLLKIEHPIIQAPMGFHTSPEMPVAVSGAGGLGSFPFAPPTPPPGRGRAGRNP